MRFIPGKGIVLSFSPTEASSTDLAELFLTVKWSGAQEDGSDCWQLPHDVNVVSEQQLATLSDPSEDSVGKRASPASRHARYQQELTTMALTAGRSKIENCRSRA